LKLSRRQTLPSREKTNQALPMFQRPRLVKSMLPSGMEKVKSMVRKLEVWANTSGGSLLSSMLLILGLIFPEMYMRKVRKKIPKRAGAWSKLLRPRRSRASEHQTTSRIRESLEK